MLMAVLFWPCVQPEQHVGDSKLSKKVIIENKSANKSQLNNTSGTRSLTPSKSM